MLKKMGKYNEAVKGGWRSWRCGGRGWGEEGEGEEEEEEEET